MKLELFLGVPFTQKPANQTLFDLFTKRDGYLTLQHFGKDTYLGKTLSFSLTYDEFVDQKKHVASIVKKILPEASYTAEDFVLISYL